jgi:hypothetical protein
LTTRVVLGVAHTGVSQAGSAVAAAATRSMAAVAAAGTGCSAAGLGFAEALGALNPDDVFMRQLVELKKAEHRTHGSPGR